MSGKAGEDPARSRPVLIEIGEDRTDFGPAEAPPVPDPDAALPPPDGRAMRAAIRLGARRPSRAARLFWAAAGGLVSLALGLAAWDFATGLLARAPMLGWLAAGLLAGLVAAALVVALREIAALGRLSRLGRLRTETEAARASEDAEAARRAAHGIATLAATRPELGPAVARFRRREADLFDAPAILDLAETELLAIPDAEARAEIEAAARQVAIATALMPVAIADVAVALAANLRMIRRIAEIYGGRAGLAGGWRLTRAVLAHLVTTGLVAMGDDFLGSVAGGGLAAKVSRRFGEGVVNAALTARVGRAAVEVCRPLPFRRLPPPRVSELLRRALAGLFERDAAPPRGDR
jgi:putative membrane protein